MTRTPNAHDRLTGRRNKTWSCNDSTSFSKLSSKSIVLSRTRSYGTRVRQLTTTGRPRVDPHVILACSAPENTGDFELTCKEKELCQHRVLALANTTVERRIINPKPNPWSALSNRSIEMTVLGSADNVHRSYWGRAIVQAGWHCQHACIAGVVKQVLLMEDVFVAVLFVWYQWEKVWLGRIVDWLTKVQGVQYI